ncbi:Gmad2 immunoglobulin-like domain-containing protein, partial [Patescibacteria group bacterium]|nr:Gmad2 immunoglobulin-like domain-containing protein [Patescibacteria group bacterium]
MKRFLPTILAVILVIGASCFVYPRSETPAVPNLTAPAPSTIVEDLFGVIDQINAADRIMRILLPDGGLEEVIFTDQHSIVASDLGLLAHVSGERELSTRQIKADAIQLIGSPNLFITSPEPGAVVTSPIIVFGFGRVFEQTFLWRLKDSSGAVVGHGYAMTSARDLGQFGPFRLEIFPPVLPDKSFTLEIFAASPRDGSEQDLVSVPLHLLSAEATTFNIFLSNPNQGSAHDCSLVYP